MRAHLWLPNKGVRRRRNIPARKAKIPHQAGLPPACAIYWLSLCWCSWSHEWAEKDVGHVPGQNVSLSKPRCRSSVIPSRKQCCRICTRRALPLLQQRIEGGECRGWNFSALPAPAAPQSELSVVQFLSGISLPTEVLEACYFPSVSFIPTP